MNGADAFRVVGGERTVHALHGPQHLGEPLWPEPYLHAAGSEAAARAWAGRGLAAAATERWEHGLLAEVCDRDRLDALAAQWGESRVADARIGRVDGRGPEPADLAAMARLGARGWLRPLVRAFEHVGAKAAWVGGGDADLGGEHAPALAAIRAAKTRPRLAVLEAWMAQRSEPSLEGDDAEIAAWGLGEDPEPPPPWRGAWIALECLDRALDAYAGGRSWFIERVPEHCRALWPLRNLMRLADRSGCALAEMRFSDFEALEAFAPELPVLCLDREIYGGGFDHDLFHRLCPMPRTGSRRADEWGLLAIESAAQAFNGLVFDGRHLGPTYDGHARWRGYALFEAMERAFGLSTLPEQLAAFRILGLVCHPRFSGDAAAVWAALVPNGVSPAAAERLIARYGRYVRLDAAWVDGLHARYETAAFHAFGGLLSDRFAGSLRQTFAAVDRMVRDAEDVDLRTTDLAATGQAAEAAEGARWLAQKCAELEHLTQRQGAPELARRAGLDAVAGEARELRARLVAVRDAAAQAAQGRPSESRDTETLERAATALAHDLDSLAHRFDGSVRTLRAAQADGLGGPAIPEDFRTAVRELFHGVDCTPPAHFGADSPGAA
ncbi:MAG: hypothetical protein R3F39_13120 [Myxococcota bacterium]